MKEIEGNLFEQNVDAICITTNGIIKRNGEGVMGAGVALEAKRRYSVLPSLLGKSLRKYGNHVAVLKAVSDYSIIAFPVKNHYRDKADIELIRRSCKELVGIADEYEWDTVALVKPGCGAGKLKWEKVKRLCNRYLDDRFFIIDK